MKRRAASATARGEIVVGLAVLLAAVLTAATAHSTRQSPAVQMADAAAEIGLDFVHQHGGHGERYMVETMGSGVALADLDVDGRLDAYFAQGASTPGGPQQPLVNRWYRGSPIGRMIAAPPHAGADDASWSMGVAVADYDDDGYPDVYVTNYGANALYRNNGDGTLSRASSGVDDTAWGSSAAWGDLNRDRALDLYVANYVDFDWDNHKFCGDPRRDLRAYCHPDVYNAAPDRLYLSNGDGTFVEHGANTGIADTLDGKGLGVVLADYDDDGDTDIYVANDSTRNFLYTNQGDGTFLEDGLLAGVAFSADGQAEAGMGADWGDFDGDGQLDVVVTNLDFETNSLYRNLGAGFFAEVSFAAGIGEPSLLQVAFGTNWMDIDNDGDLDLFVANGHIIDNIARFRDNIVYPQANHMFVNDAGQLTESHVRLGRGLQLVKVSRGSASGDLDDDGDLDLMVSNSGQAADYLRNDGGSDAGAWLQLRLVGRLANRYAVGTRVRVQAGDGGWQIREVRAGSSYASSSDPRLHFGLGDASRANVEIRWPGGGVVMLQDVPTNHLHVVHEARGVVASRAARES